MTRHSVVLHGHKTSVSVEAPFWDALKKIAADQGLSLNRLIGEIDRDRQGNLSSAIRVHVLSWYQIPRNRQLP